MTYQLLKDQVETFENGFKWRKHGLYNHASFLETIPIDFDALVDATRFSSTTDFEMYIKRLQVCNAELVMVAR